MSLSHAALSLPDRAWAVLRDHALAWWRSVYLGAVLLVLALSPSSYRRGARRAMAHQIYVQTGPILLGFTALAALLCAVITRIVIVTALSYGLSRYALEMVVRVLVIELIPLTAALFVAMRCTIPNGTLIAQLRARGQLRAWQERGADPLRMALVPRAAGGVFASVTLAVLSCVVALITVYLSVYGFTLAGLTVAIMPMASGLYAPLRRHRLGGAALGGFARMFAVLLLIEVISLMGNYY
jgi:phospholipid/cholesterol/gamma-HCH transport system permease protein